jgi:hypothetical protein
VKQKKAAKVKDGTKIAVLFVGTMRNRAKLDPERSAHSQPRLEFKNASGEPDDFYLSDDDKVFIL